MSVVVIASVVVVVMPVTSGPGQVGHGAEITLPMMRFNAHDGRRDRVEAESVFGLA